MKSLFRRIVAHLPALPIGTFIGALHLLIAVLGAGVITLFSLYFIYRSGEQASLREMRDLAAIIDSGLESSVAEFLNGSGSFEDVAATLDRFLDNRPEVRYLLLYPDGSTFPAAGPDRALGRVPITAPEVQQALSQPVGLVIRDNAQGRRMIYAATVLHREAAPGAILVMAVPLDQAMQPTYAAMRWVVLIAVLIVLFTVAEGWLGSIYISAPLVRLSQVAGRLSEGDMTARAKPEGPAEVSHLAETLNEMAARVQDSLESLPAFVANASHELRTPLTAIKLQVSALRSAREEPEAAEHFMTQIEGEIDRLEHTVNDMLDLSQLEGGGSLPQFQRIDMLDLAGEVQAFWQARARQAGLALTLDVEPDLPAVRGDPYQLRRLLDNLLDNAVKYTPAGGKIDISLRHCPPLAGKRSPDVVRVEVSDNGPGIPPEHVSHLFERFYRIETRAPGGRAKGSGLGLAIARSIVRAHGGQIGVNSLPGAGSTFWVELPVYTE
jgi:signal transduction histidine kinase